MSSRRGGGQWTNLTIHCSEELEKLLPLYDLMCLQLGISRSQMGHELVTKFLQEKKLVNDKLEIVKKEVKSLIDKLLKLGLLPVKRKQVMRISEQIFGKKS